MHNFSELIDRCVIFTSAALQGVENKAIKGLQISGSTIHVKALQMIRLEKTILAIGAFSMFDAILQDALDCRNGFAKAKEIMRNNNELKLLSQFTEMELSINAMKHGRGRSYDVLLEKQKDQLDINVKSPDENFFNEGDVSEITSLIKVDEEFLDKCAEVIRNVSTLIRNTRPEVPL